MEKKEINVLIRYPWMTSDSQYYKSIIKNPSKNIKYLSTSDKKVGMISNNFLFKLSNFLKRQIRYWTEKLNLIIVNAHLTPPGNYDIIHCAHCLSKNKNVPWILDIESIWQLWVSGRDKENAKREVLKYLEKDNCKKIIAWTKKTKEDLEKRFPEVKDKIELLYYAMPVQKQIKNTSKELTLFFSGRHFLKKGGLDAIEAIDKLTKKYDNVRGIINGAIPKNIFERYSQNKKIKMFQLMPYEKLLKIYQKSDIFVYPGYSDSFGFVFMDSMSFGSPVVTVDGTSRKEIIRDGETGFIIPKPKHTFTKKVNDNIVNELVEKTSMLIENKKLRTKMSKNCLNEIKNGKFSIIKRNKKLKRIYEDAIK